MSGSALPSLEQRLTEFYENHDKQKLNDIPKLLNKFAGKESELIAKIEEKYKVKFPAYAPSVPKASMPPISLKAPSKNDLPKAKGPATSATTASAKIGTAAVEATSPKSPNPIFSFGSTSAPHSNIFGAPNATINPFGAPIGAPNTTLNPFAPPAANASTAVVFGSSPSPSFSAAANFTFPFGSPTATPSNVSEAVQEKSEKETTVLNSQNNDCGSATVSSTAKVKTAKQFLQMLKQLNGGKRGEDEEEQGDSDDQDVSSEDIEEEIRNATDSWVKAKLPVSFNINTAENNLALLLQPLNDNYDRKKHLKSMLQVTGPAGDMGVAEFVEWYGSVCVLTLYQKIMY